jgi:hypothetical protein
MMIRIRICDESRKVKLDGLMAETRDAKKAPARPAQSP